MHPYAACLNSPAHQWADSFRNYVRQLDHVSIQLLMFGPGYCVGSRCFLHILRPSPYGLVVHLWLPGPDHQECLTELGDSARPLDSSSHIAIRISSDQDLTQVFPWVARAYSHACKAQNSSNSTKEEM